MTNCDEYGNDRRSRASQPISHSTSRSYNCNAFPEYPQLRMYGNRSSGACRHFTSLPPPPIAQIILDGTLYDTALLHKYNIAPRCHAFPSDFALRVHVCNRTRSLNTLLSACMAIRESTSSCIAQNSYLTARDEFMFLV